MNKDEKKAIMKMLQKKQTKDSVAHLIDKRFSQKIDKIINQRYEQYQTYGRVKSDLSSQPSKSGEMVKKEKKEKIVQYIQISEGQEQDFEEASENTEVFGYFKKRQKTRKNRSFPKTYQHSENRIWIQGAPFKQIVTETADNLKNFPVAQYCFMQQFQEQKEQSFYIYHLPNEKNEKKSVYEGMSKKDRMIRKIAGIFIRKGIEAGLAQLYSNTKISRWQYLRLIKEILAKSVEKLESELEKALKKEMKLNFEHFTQFYILKNVKEWMTQRQFNTFKYIVRLTYKFQVKDRGVEQLLNLFEAIEERLQYKKLSIKSRRKEFRLPLKVPQRSIIQYYSIYRTEQLALEKLQQKFSYLECSIQRVRQVIQQTLKAGLKKLVLLASMCKNQQVNFPFRNLSSKEMSKLILQSTNEFKHAIIEIVLNANRNKPAVVVDLMTKIISKLQKPSSTDFICIE